MPRGYGRVPFATRNSTATSHFRIQHRYVCVGVSHKRRASFSRDSWIHTRLVGATPIGNRRTVSSSPRVRTLSPYVPPARMRSSSSSLHQSNRLESQGPSPVDTWKRPPMTVAGKKRSGVFIYHGRGTALGHGTTSGDHTRNDIVYVAVKVNPTSANPILTAP